MTEKIIFTTARALLENFGITLIRPSALHLAVNPLYFHSRTFAVFLILVLQPNDGDGLPYLH